MNQELRILEAIEKLKQKLENIEMKRNYQTQRKDRQAVLDLEKRANLGFSRFAKHHVL